MSWTTAAHGEDHFETVAPLEGLSDVAHRRGELDTAAELLRRATNSG